MNNIQKLIEAVALGDKEQQAAAFAAIMQEKTRSAIEVKTIETAGKIYNTKKAIEETIEEAIEDVVEETEEETLTEARVKIPADIDGMVELLDKAKDIRLSGQDYDRILKALPAKTLQTWIHDAAFKHKDFQPAYAVGYQAGMGRGFPKKGGLEGNNPFKKNTLAFHAWMTVGQDGFTNGQG